LAERSTDRWIAVALEVSEDLGEEIIGRMQGYTRGVRIESDTPERCTLWIYLRAAVSAVDAMAVVEEALGSHGLSAGDCALRLETVEDGGWVERYQASLRPFDLGSRFTVFPSGSGEAREGREALYLIPGRAFGTGEHPTTQLCVEMLENYVTSGSRWVDLGCGTGILSIVARSCGAAHILAIDEDPDAVDVAREVLGRNGVTGVEIVRGDRIRAAGNAPDGIVANIGAPFFREACGVIAGELDTDGLLIASGILSDDLEEIEPRFTAVGLEPIERHSRGPWAVCVARRKAR